jgi:LacI family transcriptional regulator
VDPQLRQRVEEAIRKLNYRPPQFHHAAVQAGAPTVSFVLANRRFLHPVHAQILQGAEEYCRGAGYFVLYTCFDYRPETPPAQLSLPKILTDHRIADCVILAGMNYGNLLDALENSSVPYVVLANKLVDERERPAVDRVRWDDRTAGYDATRYLLELGHRDIHYIGDVSVPAFRNPYEGYLRAMADAGATPSAQTVPLAEDPFENGRLSMELLLDHGSPATAVFADCNIIYGVWEALRKANRQAPNDISLIAFGQQYGLLNVPPVTTVTVDMTVLGRTAAEVAVNKIRNGNRRMPEIVLPSTLMPKGTCGPVRARVPARRAS